jgi:hypothetical protein
MGLLEYVTEGYDTLIRSFVRSLRARNLSEKTIKTYKIAAAVLPKSTASSAETRWKERPGALAKTHKAEASQSRTDTPAVIKWADEEEGVSPKPDGPDAAADRARAGDAGAARGADQGAV